ncbi:MAG: carbon-nitrogen hydrolase family protein [Myxococcales bacterium]|nr:carbon-nitrogen hydrolase family protein [Myxococcales bacterium]MCB9523938.1 carbon-nitrogen hydrolase family protein [Myxococcales bacterium]
MVDDLEPELESRLEVRQLTAEDYEAVAALQRAVFPDIGAWRKEHFLAQLRRFPEGQICVELDGEVVATSSALRLTWADWDEDHDFDEVVHGGDIATHEPDGDTLYGTDMVVHPRFRGLRMARRLYEARKAYMSAHRVRRMVIAGRIPGLSRHPELSAAEYVKEVLAKHLVDPTLTVQLGMGFTVLRVMDGYLKEDHESRGAAVLMEWINPEWFPAHRAQRQHARVAAVQYRMRTIESFEDFAQQCEYYADLASDYRCDFLCYPELLTNQLICLVAPTRPAKRVRALNDFTDQYLALFRHLAIKHNVNIIGGTHLLVEEGRLYNVAFLFHRDGRVDRQEKLHITPAEARWWGVTPGDALQVFDTDAGRIAINICYDVEFPELARVAKAKGAQILFVPYNTDLRTGHVRVRTCAQARAIENHLYVVVSGMCGGLPGEEWSEIHFARSAVLTPSDIAFPRDGVAAEANDNIETLVVHDLDYARIRRVQRQGEVRPWMDRRTDLYKLGWHGEDGPMDLE